MAAKGDLSPWQPVFADISNYQLREKILDARQYADCEHESRSRSLDSNGVMVTSWHMPSIKAIGRHRSGDIWVLTATEAECRVLVKSIDGWLPSVAAPTKTNQSYMP